MARFKGFNPTRNEVESINAAFKWICDIKQSNAGRCLEFMKMEKNGYGNSNDKLPLLVAKGVCIKFFLEGIQDPHVELKDIYYVRLAALWFHGYGADIAGNTSKCIHSIVHEGRKAYQDAFDRMQAEDDAKFNAVTIKKDKNGRYF